MVTVSPGKHENLAPGHKRIVSLVFRCPFAQTSQRRVEKTKITAAVIGLEKVAKSVAQLQSVPTRPAVWRAVGLILYRESMRCFKEQRAPDGTPWAPLSPMTIWKRAYKRLGSYRNTLKRKKLLHTSKYKKFTTSMKILQDTGRLRGSISFRAEGAAAVIGSGLRYARVHQLGGKTEDGKYNIPARPFLGLSSSGRQDVVKIINAFLQKEAEKAAKKAGNA